MNNQKITDIVTEDAHDVLTVKNVIFKPQLDDGNLPETAIKVVDLFSACSDGSLQDVKNFIKQNVGINNKNAKGYTALMIAVQHGKKEIIHELLVNGADVNIEGIHGFTALTLAVGKKRVTGTPGDPNNLDNPSSSSNLKNQFNIEIVEMLLQYQGNPEAGFVLNMVNEYGLYDHFIGVLKKYRPDLFK